MAQYMLMLREDPSVFQDLSPEDMQSVIARYVAWSTKMVETGRHKGGEKLGDGEGRIVRRNGSGLEVKDGPFAETKEVLGGYFTLEADSYEEVIDLMEDLPHLDYGSVEVRRIEVVEGKD